MTINLGSFGTGFFYQEGDGDLNVESIENPTSIYQAIRCMDKELRDEIAADVFGIPADYLDDDMIASKIEETDTADGYRTPVEVYIDPEGDYTLTIYDGSENNS